MKTHSITNPRRRAVLSCLLAIAGLTLPVLGSAQNWPTKPLKIMVGASPGGGTDILARMLADKFTGTLKESVVVENRPGASNTIAADLTARAEPDGYTLLLATNTGQAIAPHVLKLKYDPLKGLQPIGLVAVMPNVLVVPAQSPYKTVKDLTAAMKAAPGDLKYASSGIASTQHVGAEAFNLAQGTQSIHVPYKGSSQAHIDLISGQVDMMFDSTSSATGQIKSGKLRPLAVAAPKRVAAMPDVPTLAEAGVKGADVNTWYGLYATGGTPPAVIEQLHAALMDALKQSDVQSRIQGLGGEIQPMSTSQFAEMNQSEFDRYGKLVKAANIKAE
ncbi:MAG: tripartite tricarboxylate transporter substrate binding protein [Burkholderiaceae bacterium]